MCVRVFGLRFIMCVFERLSVCIRVSVSTANLLVQVAIHNSRILEVDAMA